MMIKRAIIIAKGNVQMAGFRTFIKDLADSLNVKGFAENLEDGSVKVVCEGEEEGIKELINSIKENPPSFARIDEVSAEYEAYKGEFTGFERRGADVPKENKEDAMLRYMQSFDKKGEVMIGILSSMNETMGSMNETMGSMNEILKSVKGDTSQIAGIKENTEKMLEKQDNTIAEVRTLREDLKSYMENKFAKIEREIEAIKAKIGMG